MKKSIRSVLLAGVMLSGCAGLFAMDAVVTSAVGKAEVLRGNTWVALSAGDTLKKGDVIQTGFKSSLSLAIKDSKVEIAALTRMTIEQLVEKETKDETRLYLDTGKVKSEVNKTENRRVGFVVRSPVATASVRGTVWEMENTFRSTNITTDEGLVSAWPTENQGSVISTDEEDAAPEAPAVAGNTPYAVSSGESGAGAVNVAAGQKTGFDTNGGMTSSQSNAYASARGMQGSTMSAASAEADRMPGGGAPVPQGGFGAEPGVASGSGGGTGTLVVNVLPAE